MLLFTVSFGLGLGACKREESAPVLHGQPASPEARHQLDPSLPAGHPPINAQGGQMPTGGQMPMGGQMPSVPPPAAPSASETIGWDLPKGWTEARSGGMRLATLKPPVAGKVDVSLIMLPGTAGGELGNVNRWRGQVGLPPVDEAARAQMRKEVTSKAGLVSVYDFTGEGAEKQRMVAGLLFTDGRSWFFKMTGDPDAVGSAKADFLKLLESLRPPQKQ